MDAFTLILATVLTSAVMTITMFVMYRASPRETCLLDWGVAGILFLATNAISLAATLGPMPFFLAPAIVNAVYIAAHGAVLAGVRRHLGLKPGWPILIALFVTVLAAHALPFVQASVANRLISFYPIVIALNLGTALVLWRAPPDAMKPAHWPLILVELVFALQLLVRLVLLHAGGGADLTFLGSQFLQTSGSLFILLFVSVATMGCALIVIRHQELALRRASRTDGLTGWLNRHALLELTQSASRRGENLPCAKGCIIFDIDHFKAINDRHGHATGDRALRHVTSVAAASLRDHEARFRIGGEEFAVLIADGDIAELLSIADQLRRDIAAAPLAGMDTPINITISVGVTMQSHPDEHWEAMFQRADLALYEAKRGGRNRVVVAPDTVAQNPDLPPTQRQRRDTNQPGS